MKYTDFYEWKFYCNFYVSKECKVKEGIHKSEFFGFIYLLPKLRSGSRNLCPQTKKWLSLGSTPTTVWLPNSVTKGKNKILSLHYDDGFDSSTRGMSRDLTFRLDRQDKYFCLLYGQTIWGQSQVVLFLVTCPSFSPFGRIPETEACTYWKREGR